MRMSRARVVVLGVFMCGSAIGHHTSAATASAPSVNIHRITAFNGTGVAADFDGDGVVDVAATGSASVAGGHPVVVALGKGDSSFGAPIATALNGDVLATGDFNKDGLPDLIAEAAADDPRARRRPMAHAALIGIAVTSHSPGVETMTSIDDVRIER